MRFISDDKADMRPVWMSQKEIGNPDKLLSGFCQDYTITDCRYLLWQMLTASLSTENQDGSVSTGEKIYFFENLMPFIEAIYLRVEGKASPENPDNIEMSALTGGDDLSAVSEQESAKCGAKRQKAKKDDNRKLKKWQKHLRKNSVWYREKIDDPYEVISTFFDASSLADFRSDLYGILQACNENHFYQKSSPADVLYFFENLESIINASFLILKASPDCRPGKTSNSIEVTAEFYGHADQKSSGQTVLLGEERWREIRAILVSFFEYKSLKQWKEDLYEICLFALGSQAAEHWGVWIDVLPIYAHIIGLIDAVNCSGLNSELTDIGQKPVKLGV